MTEKWYNFFVKILSLDIGLRRTGAAIADDTDGVAIALPTITHASQRELLDSIRSIIAKRGIDRIVLGLPLLPSGMEGAQTALVRSIGDKLMTSEVPLSYVDERYTTQNQSDYDGDAAAAVELLLIWLRKSQIT